MGEKQVELIETRERVLGYEEWADLEAGFSQEEQELSKSSGLRERVPKYGRWTELEANLLKGHVKGRWRGDVPSIVFLTTVTMGGLFFKDYAHLTIPLVYVSGLVAIFLVRKWSYERSIPDSPEPRGQPGGEIKDRAPPVGD